MFYIHSHHTYLLSNSSLSRSPFYYSLWLQAGSFVPAKAATIGLVDRIFTRIGASDNLSENMSTYMVEMTEFAKITRDGMPSMTVITIH